jgi:hypothetical protein
VFGHAEVLAVLMPLRQSVFLDRAGDDVDEVNEVK